MRGMDLLYYARRQMTGRPWQTILNALGVAVGVALVIALFSLTIAYQRAITTPFTSSGTSLVLSNPAQGSGRTPAATGVILPASNRVIDMGEVGRLANLPGARQITATLQLWSFDPGRYKVIVGVDPDAPAIGPAMARQWIEAGRYFNRDESGVAVLEYHYARFCGYKVGSQITIAGKQFKVIGIFKVQEGAQLTAANVYLPLADAQALAGVGPNTVNTIYLELKDAGTWKQSIAAIHGDFPDLAVTDADSSLTMSDSMLALLQKFAWPGAALIIALCLLFVFRSLSASIEERIGEFGTMKTVGWRRRDVQHLLTVELLIQVIIGAVLGMVLGSLGAYLISLWQVTVPQVGMAPPLPGMASTAATIRLQAVFPLALYLSCFGAAILIGFLVAVTIARRVSALKPSEAWRQL